MFHFTSRNIKSILALYLTCCIAPMLQCAPFVYLANQGSNTVSVIDASNNYVLANIDLGPNNPGNQIAIAPDGNTVYIPCYDGSIGTIQRIDTTTKTLLPQIILGNNMVAKGIVMSPDGLYIYAVSYDTAHSIGYITKIIVATNSIDNNVSIAFEPLLIFITPNGSTAYITDRINTMLPVDLTTNAPTPQASLAISGINFIAISPLNPYLYASSPTQGIIEQYNISNPLSPSFSQTIDYPLMYPFMPSGLAITSDDTTLYVANAQSNLIFYDIGTINISNPASPITEPITSEQSIICPSSAPFTAPLTSNSTSIYVSGLAPLIVQIN